MAIAQDIRAQLKTAMREKDQTALDTLRGVLSGFTNELVASGKTPQDKVSDDMALKVITRLIKQRKDAFEQYKAAGRDDLAENEAAQMKILEQYLPAQMNDEDIRAIAERKKAELNVTDKAKVGILVGAVMKEVAGQADGSRVKTIVESLF